MNDVAIQEAGDLAVKIDDALRTLINRWVRSEIPTYADQELALQARMAVAKLRALAVHPPESGSA